MKLKMTLLLFSLLVALLSCHPNNGNKFVGKWKSIDGSLDVTIEKMGNSFTVSFDDPDESFPAGYNSDQDKLEFSFPGKPAYYIFYDPNKKHILMLNQELEKK